MLSESSERAGRECYLSQESCRLARETVNTWKDAMERFQDVLDNKFEDECARSPVRCRAAVRGCFGRGWS